MKTSIIILTYNHLNMTVNCLNSIKRNTPEEHEVIVVDNGSTDGTVEYLKQQEPEIKLIINGSNLGFAKGCNQGLAVSEGDAILFLNNDTVVPPGWLAPLLQQLYADDETGMTGPVSNFISGHQQIPVTYGRIEDMDAFAGENGRLNRGKTLEVRRLIGFCLLVKRSVLDEIGPFDERYGLGNYEDDDLCLRAIRAGYRLLVVLDSFIHHIGHASMGQLPDTSLQNLLKENAEKARLKWGAPIHSLLYAPYAAITATVRSDNAEKLEATLASLAAVADEIIVLDCAPTEESLHTTSRYTDRIYTMKGEADPLWVNAWMNELASGAYVLPLTAGDCLDPVNRRKLKGLKLALNTGYESVALSPDGKYRLFRKGVAQSGNACFGITGEVQIQPS